jgi:hypothetical protein
MNKTTTLHHDTLELAKLAVAIHATDKKKFGPAPADAIQAAWELLTSAKKHITHQLLEEIGIVDEEEWDEDSYLTELRSKHRKLDATGAALPVPWAKAICIIVPRQRTKEPLSEAELDAKRKGLALRESKLKGKELALRESKLNRYLESCGMAMFVSLPAQEGDAILSLPRLRNETTFSPVPKTQKPPFSWETVEKLALGYREWSKREIAYQNSVKGRRPRKNSKASKKSSDASKSEEPHNPIQGLILIKRADYQTKSKKISKK